MFSEPEKWPSTHHNLPTIHHNFTTKTPHLNAHFRETPCKNAHSPREKIIAKKLDLRSQPGRSGAMCNVHIA
jgi:hypothetical protein